MPLFQTAVLNKYLKQQDSARVDAAYAGFKGHFHAQQATAYVLHQVAATP